MWRASREDRAAPLETCRFEAILRALRRDLPRQYSTEMDWSVYAADVIFVDPVTRLEGKLLYRGMIATLRLITSLAFEGATATFDLHSIQPVRPGAATASRHAARAVGREVDAVEAISTTWATRGRTRWGKDFQITGDDIFRINGEGFIVTHESAWNEDPSEVWAQFRP